MRFTIVLGCLVALATLSGCFIFGGGDNPSNPHFWTIEIIYKNSKGENLLDPITVGHYYKDSLKVLQLGNTNSGGGPTSVETGPNGSFMVTSYEAHDDKVEVVLQLNKHTYDTLTLLGDDVLRRVLYNKKEIPLPANIATSANFYFTVVK